MALHTILVFLSILIIAGWKTVACKKLRAAALLYQKDEFETLGDWITYHGGIFGYNNMYIMDNQSTLPAVKNMLDLASRMGAHITYDPEPYKMRQVSVTRLMKEIFHNDTSVDVIIPLDIDEFIVARDGQRYTTSTEKIMGEIESLPEDGFKYKFVMMNAAACPSTRLVPWARRVMNAVRFARPFLGAINKSFFHRKGFITTDQGNHVGRVAADDICDKASATQLKDLKQRGITKMDKFCFHETRLALVHYGHLALTFSSYKAKIQRGFEAYNKTLGEGCEGRGVHYCKEWHSITEDEDARRKKFEDKACQSGMYESTFIAAALLGDRSQYLEFPPDVALP